MIMVAEATLQIPRIEAERDTNDHIQIDHLRGGTVALDTDQAAKVALFILATNPMREPGTCQICGRRKGTSGNGGMR